MWKVALSNTARLWRVGVIIDPSQSATQKMRIHLGYSKFKYSWKVLIGCKIIIVNIKIYKTVWIFPW